MKKNKKSDKFYCPECGSEIRVWVDITIALRPDGKGHLVLVETVGSALNVENIKEKTVHAECSECGYQSLDKNPSLFKVEDVNLD
jgi:predicted RNA-binding Zn-ribbon protein involved in translation (DUF1610 family)